MKKYYIIYILVGLFFLLCFGVLFFNPEYIALYHNVDVSDKIDNSPIGPTFMTIAGIVFAIAAIIAVGYLVYKATRKLINRKKNEDVFTSDTSEFYTKKQSSENISKWLISTSRGRLDKDNKNNSRKK